MVRPCYLVVDVEHGGSISTRKLVIETAKLNVLTAYSGAEAIETVEKFPAVDGAVVDAVMPDMACQDLVKALKGIRPELLIIVVGKPGGWRCDAADHVLDTFDPTRLMDLLKSLQPEPIEAIQARDAELSAQAH